MKNQENPLIKKIMVQTDDAETKINAKEYIKLKIVALFSYFVIIETITKIKYRSKKQMNKEDLTKYA